MPTYEYECEDHGYFELTQSMKDHARAECPTCGSDCKQVMLSAPSLDIEGMADAGCPGAFMTSGDRITKRHQAAGQDHTASASQKKEMHEKSMERIRSASVSRN